MTDEQLKTIAGLLAGYELAVVHLARLLALKSGTPMEAMATSFIATGDALTAGAPNRDLMLMVMRRIAADIAGIAGSEAGGAPSDELARLLH